MDDTVDWADISRRLRAPFDPADVDFRVQGKPGASGKAQCVAYIDARAVQDRLDDVVGPGAWSFDWAPLITDKGDVQVAKGTLTIHGVAKSDAGTASNFEQSLGAVSHCFKRAAVMWGIGRYLYDLPAAWVAVEGNGRIPAQVLAELRAKLPRPTGAAQKARPVAQQEPEPTSEPAAQQPAQTAKARKAGEWATADGYDPISDMTLRGRVKALGINNMADFETLLTYGRGHYNAYTKAAIDAEVTEREEKHRKALAKVNGGANGANGGAGRDLSRDAFPADEYRGA